MRFSWMLVMLAVSTSGCGQLADLLRPKGEQPAEEAPVTQTANFVFAETVSIGVSQPIAPTMDELPPVDAPQILSVRWQTPGAGGRPVNGEWTIDLSSAEYRNQVPLFSAVQGGVIVKVECARTSPSCLRRTINLTYSNQGQTQTAEGWIEFAGQLNVTAELFPYAHRDTTDDTKEAIEGLIGPVARDWSQKLSTEDSRVRGTGWTARIQGVKGTPTSCGAIRLNYETETRHGVMLVWTRNPAQTASEWRIISSWSLNYGMPGVWVPKLASSNVSEAAGNQSAEEAFWRETDRTSVVEYRLGTEYPDRFLSFPFVRFELDRR